MKLPEPILDATADGKPAGALAVKLVNCQPIITGKAILSRGLAPGITKASASANKMKAH